jgi:hypothetical protein
MNELNGKGGRGRKVLLVIAVLAAVSGMTLLSSARTPPAVSVTITNNSQLQIRGLYVAVGNPDNWGPEQLNGSIAPGASHTLSNVSCDGSSVRVVAEDINGCFYYHSLSSCDANQTWTITASESPDCGS